MYYKYIGSSWGQISHEHIIRHITRRFGSFPIGPYSNRILNGAIVFLNL